jgi:hypothetical protein
VSRRRARIKVKTPEEFLRWQRLIEQARQREETEAKVDKDVTDIPGCVRKVL